LALERHIAMDALRVEVFRIRAKLRDMMRDHLAVPAQETNRGFPAPLVEDDK